MTVFDPKRDEHDVGSAKRKLSEVTGRPIDVDIILAKQRAKQERQTTVAREAAATIDQILKQARAKRDAIRADRLIEESQAQKDAQSRFEEEKRQFELKQQAHAKTKKVV